MSTILHLVACYFSNIFYLCPLDVYYRKQIDQSYSSYLNMPWIIRYSHYRRHWYLRDLSLFVFQHVNIRQHRISHKIFQRYVFFVIGLMRRTHMPWMCKRLWWWSWGIFWIWILTVLTIKNSLLENWKETRYHTK